MAEAKSGTLRGKSKSKSKRSSPRLYDLEGLPHFMQTTYNPKDEHAYRRTRPQSEILKELRRLSTLTTSVDDEEREKQVSSEPVRTLKDLDALRLTRYRIVQLLQCYNFEAIIRDCFVRLNVNADSPIPDYRIAEIMSVERLSQGYYVGTTPTNIALHLRFEDLLERHELNDISNIAFTQEEFDLWHDNCICQAIDFPTSDLIARKKLEIYNALNTDIKVSSMQTDILTLPMRPKPRGSLLDRFGGVYPWKLQRPAELLPKLAGPQLYPLDSGSETQLGASKEKKELEPEPEPEPEPAPPSTPTLS